MDVFVDVVALSFGPYQDVIINEDAPVGSLVLQLTVTGADASSTITFSMVSIERRGRRQTDTFTVNASGAVLTDAPLDADTQDTYVWPHFYNDEYLILLNVFFIIGTRYEEVETYVLYPMADPCSEPRV